MNTFTTAKGTELPILNLKGKDYLQVAHRLVWFREEHPAWSIESDLIKIENNFALAKATIKNEKGEIIATAHKREDASHFPDFIEKAETGSIGRALAYCGYGTQFCGDEIAEGHRIVDAPQAPTLARLGNVATVTARVAPAQPAYNDGAPAPAGSPYRFKTGKYKMRSAEEVGAKDLEGWVSFWDRKIHNGEQVSGGLAQDLAHAKDFLAYQAGALQIQQEEDEELPF